MTMEAEMSKLPVTPASMMLKSICSFTLLILLAAFLFSCATPSSPKNAASPSPVINPEVVAKEIESSNQLKAMNEKILMASLAGQRGASRDYKIGSEDLLEITVFEEEKLNKTVRVSSQGNISLPLLGVLHVKGLTATEVEKEIRDLLAEKYLKDPQVSVFIKEYRSQRISVIGAVDKPGVYEVTGQKTILAMLAMAGGLKGDVSQTAGQLLFLLRPPDPDESPGESPKEGETENMPKTFVIDLDDLLVKGDMSLNLFLRHGDIINVPAAGKVFVGGEVVKPGGFPIVKKLTVSQAIAMAEGLKPKAKASETRIFRYSGKDGGKEVLTANITEIQNGKAEDLYLKENDVIVVPMSGVKAFLLEFRDTIKGLMYLPIAASTF